MIEAIILCTIFGVFILISYTLGLRNGQRLSTSKEIKSPIVNPVEVLTKEIKKYEDNKKQQALDVIMSNIDNYDGTGLGQIDIPNRR